MKKITKISHTDKVAVKNVEKMLDLVKLNYQEVVDTYERYKALKSAMIIYDGGYGVGVHLIDVLKSLSALQDFNGKEYISGVNDAVIAAANAREVYLDLCRHQGVTLYETIQSDLQFGIYITPTADKINMRSCDEIKGALASGQIDKELIDGILALWR